MSRAGKKARASEPRLTRREILAVAGVGAVWCAVPAGGELTAVGASAPAPVPVRLPGADRVLQPALEALRHGERLAWRDDRATLRLDAGGAVARIRRTTVGDSIEIEVESPAGYVALTGDRDGGVCELYAQPATFEESVFDTVRRSDHGLVLTTSSDLAGRHCAPSLLDGARLDPSYQRFATLVDSRLATRVGRLGR